MALVTKVSGRRGKLAGQEDSYMLTVTVMRVFGEMAKPVDKASMCTLMAAATSANSTLTIKTVSAGKNGPMVPCSKDSSLMDGNTDRASFSGQTEAAMSASLTIIKSAERAPTSGQIEGCTRALGTITRWRAWAYSHGQMGVNTSDSTITITSMGVVFSCGRTESGTKVNGEKVFSMEKGFSAYLMAQK